MGHIIERLVTSR